MIIQGRASYLNRRPPAASGMRICIRASMLYSIDLTNWKLQQWRWYHTEMFHFWESQNRYATNSSPNNVLLPPHYCMENRRSHLDYPGPNASCCGRGLQVHPREVRLPSSWHGATDGYIRVQFLWCFHHPLFSIHFSNHLSKPPYPVYILSIPYIKQSIICLKTSYHHLTERQNGRIHWEYFPTNSNILGRSSLDPGLLVPRLHPHVCRSPRVSHHWLKRLRSSAVFLWVDCVRLRTYLQVLVGIAWDLLQ
jgi:hypothetical protein